MAAGAAREGPTRLGIVDLRTLAATAMLNFEGHLLDAADAALEPLGEASPLPRSRPCRRTPRMRTLAERPRRVASQTEAALASSIPTRSRSPAASSSPASAGSRRRREGPWITSA